MRMGKIIVKNMSKMGWKARIGLIALFTLVCSLFIYDGLYRAKGSNASVAIGTAWQSVHAAAPGAAVARNKDYSVTSSGYTAAAGANRLLLVSVYYELATAASAASIDVTFGGVTVNPIVTTATGARIGHVWLGYIANANIPAASSTVTAVLNRVSGATNVSSVAIKVGTYTGVDQGAPIVGSSVNQTTNVTVAGTAAVSYLTGGKTVVASSNGGVTATPAYTATPTLTTNAGATSTTGQSAYIAETAAHTASSSGTVSITYSGTTAANSTIAIASLRPATTTLGTGINGTSATVAPGAANQKLGGFSLVTGSAGTTDSIAGLTVTTTNFSAIGSISIWNEAGTTQYFTTVSNPASNTIAFSGGTAIPVTNTTANLMIRATYKTRAGGAPSGTTTTTGYVSAFTSNNVTSGSDTADTTLTVSNVHAASTWGTCTASDNQVVLNWTKGTVGQSLIIVRYTNSASDTTKPVDGSTYSVGAAFGTGGTVRYNAAGTTYTDTSGIANGTTYYYKIFEYDTFNNYYNASDVWTPALTPVTSDPSPPVVIPGFAVTTPVNTVNIPIIDGSYSATDVGSGVAGYLITSTSTPPSAGAAGWAASPPTTFTVAGQGEYTLYPWAKDAAGQVSAVYPSAPVMATVDLTKPTVSAFTVTYVIGSAVKTFQIPFGSFTGSDTGGSGLNGYMITTSATPPAFDDENWLATAPTSYTVVADGDLTLYPWTRDAAGNVSNVFGSPRAVKVDTTGPTGLLPSAPTDDATDLPLATSVTCTTASDGSGIGGILYQFQLNGDDTSNINSGWQAGTTFSPTLVKGVRYVWTVKAKDSLGNESAWSTPRSFTIIAPCVRNNPTLTLLTNVGGIAKTISTFEGTADYDLKIWNNDTGDCGPTTFNLSLADVVPSDYTGHFVDTVFTENSAKTIAVNLPTGGTSTKVVRAKSAPEEDTGVMSTTATAAADPYHQAQTTGFVQTTLNVVTCVPKTPLLIVGPDAGFVNRGGKFVYTITVKNTDLGSACPNVVYNLTVPSETNGISFDASQLNTASLTLGSGQLGSATLTVSAKAAALKNAINISTIHVGATGHTSPADVTVRSTVNNPMLHNSDNVNSTKWSVSGGWGIPNGRYGEIKCVTCHVGGGGDTVNVKRMNEKIFTPYTTGTSNRFPGNGQPIAYRRYVGNSPTKPVLGWDAPPASPRASSSKICEVCHTYDATKTNGTIAHPYATAATLGNHFNTDGADCTRCHKHNQGFGAANMLCTGCHGNSSVTEITAANRYVVAPPTTTTGATGTLTGTGQVSNNAKVGAHQTHLQLLNGFTNYSTVDYRCQGCHGPIPSGFSHADGISSPNTKFEGLANNRGGMSPSFNSGSLTCSNTYCHNPSGSGGTLANPGLATFPSWTSAAYIADGTKKTQNNCNRCHKSPGDSGFSFQAAHTLAPTIASDCTLCHGHNGDSAGESGKRHLDGIRYAAKDCNNCHAYDTNGSTWTPNLSGGAGPGAHAIHINFIKSRISLASLTPTGQTFGAGEPAALCGTCHTNTLAEHTDGSRHITFGAGGTTNTMGSGYSGSMSLLFGPSNPSFSTGAKSCSNLLCHYAVTPSWY